MGIVICVGTIVFLYNIEYNKIALDLDKNILEPKKEYEFKLNLNFNNVVYEKQPIETIKTEKNIKNNYYNYISNFNMNRNNDFIYFKYFKY